MQKGAGYSLTPIGNSGTGDKRQDSMGFAADVQCLIDFLETLKRNAAGTTDMAAVIRVVKASDFCNSVAVFIRNYDRKGFFSFKWAACDIVIIAAALILIAK